MLHYEISGSGEPLVLIHGFCENLRIWDNVVPMLSLNHQVIAIDLPGFGKSPFQEELDSIASVANDIHQELRVMGITNYSVAGHSLGGYVALELINQFPNEIEGITLVHSTAFADSEEKIKNRLRSIEFVGKRGVELFIKSFVPQLFVDKKHPNIGNVVDIASKTSKQTLIRYSRLMMKREDHSKTLQKWSKKHTFIAGEKDALVPIAVSHDHREFVSKNNFFVLPDVGHISMYEAPKALYEAVESRYR